MESSSDNISESVVFDTNIEQSTFNANTLKNYEPQWQSKITLSLHISMRQAITCM